MCGSEFRLRFLWFKSQFISQRLWFACWLLSAHALSSKSGFIQRYGILSLSLFLLRFLFCTASYSCSFARFFWPEKCHFSIRVSATCASLIHNKSLICKAVKGKNLDTLLSYVFTLLSLIMNFQSYSMECVWDISQFTYSMESHSW